MTRRSALKGARSSWVTEKSMAWLIEVLPANDRGSSTSLPPKLRADVAVGDHRPVDHDVLLARRRPFDEAYGDAPVRAGGDGLHHLGMGDGGRGALALQLELGFGHAARDVGRQHQQQIDGIGRPHRRRGKRQRQAQQCRHHSHHVRHLSIPCRPRPKPTATRSRMQQVRLHRRSLSAVPHRATTAPANSPRARARSSCPGHRRPRAGGRTDGPCRT